MKKTIVIFTLSLITLVTMASFLFFKNYLSHYKSEFKTYLLKNKEIIHTTKISILSNELYKNTERIVWEDENKEVVINGILYDVILINESL